jgi:hypothetical protein
MNAEEIIKAFTKQSNWEELLDRKRKDRPWRERDTWPQRLHKRFLVFQPWKGAAQWHPPRFISFIAFEEDVLVDACMKRSQIQEGWNAKVKPLKPQNKTNTYSNSSYSLLKFFYKTNSLYNRLAIEKTQTINNPKIPWIAQSKYL